MSHDKPFQFGNGPTREKHPHAGSSKVPPEVRETPYDEQATISHDTLPDIPHRMEWDDKERALAESHRIAREKELAKKRRKKISNRITAVVAGSGLVVAGGTLWLAKGINDNTEARDNPGVSAPAEPGTNDSETGDSLEGNYDIYSAPEGENAWLSGDNEFYSEMKSPMIMDIEQQTRWESGNYETQNIVAGEVFAPRLQVALYDMYQAKVLGKEYDISYLTTDPVVIKQLEDIVQKNIDIGKVLDGDEVNNELNFKGMLVCRDASFELNSDPSFNICHPDNNATGREVNFSPNGPNNGEMFLLIARITENNMDGDQRDQDDPSIRNNNPYTLQAQLLKQGDALSLVSK